MKILSAIDGSRHSQWTLDRLLHVCSPDNSSLLLVHAVDLVLKHAPCSVLVYRS